MMQMLHLGDTGCKAEVGYAFEADLKHVQGCASQNSAGELLHHPILAHLPDL